MDIEHPDFVLFLECAQENHLRYMCIGGYAVNFYGFHRVTEDLDIWIAPTEANKQNFIDTLLCMGYNEQETDPVRKEDFSTYFMCSLGAPPHVIDVLTIVHHQISFDEAEKSMIRYEITDKTELRIVPYESLKDIKLRSSRHRDLDDVYQLEKLRKK